MVSGKMTKAVLSDTLKNIASVSYSLPESMVFPVSQSLSQQENWELQPQMRWILLYDFE